jgi:hypothetical protein
MEFEDDANRMCLTFNQEGTIQFDTRLSCKTELEMRQFFAKVFGIDYSAFFESDRDDRE